MRVVIDAMGGDHAPQAVLDGVRLALQAEPDLQLILTGLAEVVCPIAEEFPQQIEAVPTTEIISMDDAPAEAIRIKKDSSIVVGCKLVAEGQAAGFFSAGSTGAVMTAATLVMGRIKGISRPMIIGLLPTITGGWVAFGDIGANSDVKAEYLLQYALMGEAYARIIMGINVPRVGLLNIGEEASKGNDLARQAYQLLSQELDGFVGNAEGTDIMSGRFDLIVTDGFTGNVVLKTIEGVASMLFGGLKEVMTASLPSKLAAAVIKPGLSDLKKKLSADDVGGAPLLGVRGSCLIGHGSSSPKAIANGILATDQAIRLGLNTAIAEAVSI
ncbi:MAG: phosphate acyltransferase PlsX [Coriobacteriales bacterium]|nr:phosphate acyltransferase PlsX [Coriobacteriales bacterium]